MKHSITGSKKSYQKATPLRPLLGWIFAGNKILSRLNVFTASTKVLVGLKLARNEHCTNLFVFSN